MKKLLFTVLLSTAVFSFAVNVQTTMHVNGSQNKQAKHQLKFGLKAGFNISRMSGNAINFDQNSKNEFIFSRTSHTFLDDAGRNKVTTDYICLPQLTTFTIGKILQLQAGGQMVFLIKTFSKKSILLIQKWIDGFYEQDRLWFCGGRKSIL